MVPTTRYDSTRSPHSLHPMHQKNRTSPALSNAMLYKHVHDKIRTQTISYLESEG